MATVVTATMKLFGRLSDGNGRFEVDVKSVAVGMVLDWLFTGVSSKLTFATKGLCEVGQVASPPWALFY